MDWMRKKANKKANKMRNAMNRGQVFHGTGNVLGSTTTDGTQDRSKMLLAAEKRMESKSSKKVNREHTENEDTAVDAELAALAKIERDRTIQEMGYDPYLVMMSNSQQTLSNSDINDSSSEHRINTSLNTVHGDQHSEIVYTKDIQYIKHHNTLEDGHIAIQTLLRIYQNIQNHPNDEKYRMLKTSNKHLQRKLFSKSGCVEFLLLNGFAQIDDGYVLVHDDRVLSCVLELSTTE